MPGPPPKPPDQRRRTNKPTSGPFVPSVAQGWQHGDPADKRRKYPAPPVGLLDSSVAAWDAWMASWWAANWAPEDLPALRMVITQFDLCERGQLDVTKLKTVLESFGLTPYGRLKLHWLPPKDEAAKVEAPKEAKAPRLRVVDTA